MVIFIMGSLLGESEKAGFGPAGSFGMVGSGRSAGGVAEEKGEEVELRGRVVSLVSECCPLSEVLDVVRGRTPFGKRGTGRRRLGPQWSRARWRDAP